MPDSKSFKPDLRIAGCGVLMGAADIVPGVSGGTVARLGIYHRLVTAISHIDATALKLLSQRRFKDAADHIDLRFLVALELESGRHRRAGIPDALPARTPAAVHVCRLFRPDSRSGILVGRSIPEWNA